MTGLSDSAKPARTARGVPVRYRWAVAARAVSAIGGGYALAAATASGLGLLFVRLGMFRSDAVLTANMLAFVAAAVAAMWAFGCATVGRAWLGILVPTLGLSALVWLLRGGVA